MTQLKNVLFLSLLFSLTLSCTPKSNSNGLNGKNQQINPLATQALVRYDYAVGEVAALCDGAIQTLKDKLTAPVSALDFESALADFGDATTPLSFMGYVNTNATTRQEGSDCEAKQGQTMTDIFTRRDLYAAVKATKSANPDQDRLISEQIRSFEQNGMALSDADLEQFRALNKQLTALESNFSQNLNEENSTIEFSKDELAGTPDDYIQSHAKTAEGKYIITSKSTDYVEVMDNAKNPDTRHKMLAMYEKRAGDANSKILNDAIVLRRQIAKLVGKPTWADYRIQGRMAKDAQEVMGFLTDLKVRLQPRLKKDLDILLAAKKDMEDPNATQLNAWDIRYFANQVIIRDYSVDEDAIREYFPKDIVMKGLFEVYSTILGVTYKEVTDAKVWAAEVKLYEIRDTKTDVLIGYFYADFVPREGKYGHAAAFSLISGRVLNDGNYSKPISSIVANLTPPTADKPSLLTHDEVQTIFHEFGHIMHQTLTRAPFASLSGSGVAQDFVEAPSQMLENWVWDAEVLGKLSGHYLDPTKKLPADLIAKMIAAKDFNLGYFYSRQITFGLTDMKIHMDDTVTDTNVVYRQMHQDVMGFPTVENSQFMASFGHMMGGYDAGYYGYIWSEVYAADMFTAFQADGLLSPVRGALYRQNILERGNMETPLALITKFLGRAPNNQAFLKKLGI